MLAVIDLAVLDTVHDRTGLVAIFAHMEQDRGIEPVDVLGRHDAGIGAKRLLHQVVHCVRVERTVVVAEKEERGSLDHAEGFVAGCGVARPVGQEPHEGLGEKAGDAHRDLGLIAGHEDQDGELLVLLGGQGGQRIVEPRTRPGGHQDRNHCRNLGVHQVFEANRSKVRDPCCSGGKCACNCLSKVILL